VRSRKDNIEKRIFYQIHSNEKIFLFGKKFLFQFVKNKIKIYKILLLQNFVYTYFFNKYSTRTSKKENKKKILEQLQKNLQNLQHFLFSNRMEKQKY